MSYVTLHAVVFLLLLSHLVALYLYWKEFIRGKLSNGASDGHHSREASATELHELSTEDEEPIYPGP